MKHSSVGSKIARNAVHLCLALVLSSLSQYAHTAVTIADGELELLPDYCKDAQTIRYGDAYFNKSPRADHWVSLMGKAFWAMHHYCWALTNLRRASFLPASSLKRKGLLDEVHQDYYYVIANAQPGFVMLPEIYLRIGEVELLRGKTIDALDAFQQSRSIKPSYWPAYTRAIDILEKLNKPGDAKSLAATGLRFAPTSTELLKRYRKLGGDPSLIVPDRPPPTASTPSGGDTPEAAPMSSESASRPTESDSSARQGNSRQ